MAYSKFNTLLQNAGREIRNVFNVSGDLEPQNETEISIRSGVAFRGSQLLVLVFAIFIASLGLNTNSIPVIIGAMLISPLMGPIFGMGLAIAISDFTLLRKGLRNIGMAILGSIIASAIYFLISPQYEGASQLLARTSPSIYDVFIALFGGGAGIVSIAVKNKGQVMPGVAIATSLMPPLCTAGYGVATMQMHFFLGALYLFFTNMIFILFATWIGLKLMGFKRMANLDDKRAKRVQRIVYAIIFATVGVSVYLTVLMIQKNIFMAKATQFVESEMVFPNTQVLNHKETFSGGKRTIDVTLIGEALPKDSLQLAMLNKLDSVGLGGTILNIRQGFAIGADVDQSKSFNKFYAIMQGEIAQRQITIDSLQSVIRDHLSFTEQSVRVAPEVKIVFPQVKDIALTRMVAASTSSNGLDTVNMAFVKSASNLNEAERAKLVRYLQVRLQRDSIHLVINPQGFPWPLPHKTSANVPAAGPANVAKSSASVR